MDQFLKESALGALMGSTPFSLEDMLMGIILAFVLSSLMTLVYRQTHSGTSYSRSFSITMILMAVTIAFIMMVIGSNLARAFSLVGALSIIRFRNAVKETRDTSYIFLTMAIGMACGTKLYLMAIVFTIFTSILIYLFEKFQFAGSLKQERVFQFTANSDFKETDKIESRIKELAGSNYSLLSSEGVGGKTVLTYSLELKKDEVNLETVNSFQAISPDLEVKVVAGFERFNI